jgi:hypothetical protein
MATGPQHGFNAIILARNSFPLRHNDLADVAEDHL